jgi:hypothetical protein
MNENPFILSRHSGTALERTVEMKKAFDWTLQTMKLLRRLESVLLATIKTWKLFSSPDGDISYFCGTDEAVISPAALRSLCAIKGSFSELQYFQEKMTLLNRCCSESLEAVSPNLLLFTYSRFVSTNSLN